MDNKIFTKQIRRPPRASARLLQLYEHTTFIGVLLIPVPKTRVPNKCAKQKLHGKKRWYFYNFIEKNLRPLHFPWLQSWTNRSLSTIQRVSLKICREERSLLCGKDSQLFNNNSSLAIATQEWKRKNRYVSYLLLMIVNLPRYLYVCCTPFARFLQTKRRKINCATCPGLQVVFS